MFRHTNVTLTLKQMPTLNKFKIHPPLPLSPRESKQLLNLLTTSFRYHLDKAHGFRTELDKTTGRFNAYNTVKERRRSQSDSDIKPPTDSYLISVLTNPLFNAGAGSSFASNDAMSIFQRGEARGLMNIHYAKLCLIAKKKAIIQSPILTIRQGMKESGAGLQVLRWLVASGSTESNEFLGDNKFADILMEFMVAEELQEAAWKWIKRGLEDLSQLFTLSGKERSAARKVIVRPLLSLVKAEAAGSETLDSAYICLSRAASYLTGLSRSQMILVLGPPGSFLSHATSMIQSDHLPPSESAFDSFLSLVPVITNITGYHFAQLKLRHPTRPSADTALAFLQEMESGSVDNLNLTTSPRPQDIITLGLSASRFLLEESQFEDAEWVMNYLQKNFAQELGVNIESALDKAKAEASSLNLLEGLTLA